MICQRCGKPMYRVVNADGGSKATCSGCCQFVDCARCAGCGDMRCLGCYNKAALAAGKPKNLRAEPIISDEEAL